MAATKYVLLFSICSLLLGAGQTASQLVRPKGADPDSLLTLQQAVPVTPFPETVQLDSGVCVLTAASVIITDTMFLAEARFLSDYIHAEVALTAQGPGQATEAVTIECIADDRITQEEGYTISIEPSGIRMRASRPAGMFYAVQTLRQLLPPDAERGGGRVFRLPCLHITDAPRYPWRGVMLDCARHYQSVDYVKKFLRLAAMHKVNIFHWHLTDDQGWRIESRRYPLLHEIGAWRQQNGETYGGYYTQEELRDIVRYAASLHITVVPEIEMPGHSFAVLVAYPELSCTGGPFTMPYRWGVFKDLLCAGKEGTYSFVRGILEEVAALFPSPWIHLGGDEVLTTRWEACADCQALYSREGMQHPQQLVDHFQAYAVHVLDSLGRLPFGWSEMLMGDVPPQQHIQAWYGHWSTVDAIGRGAKAIVSQHDICYLHHDYLTVPLRTAYDFDPYPPDLDSLDSASLLGIEACLWGEGTPTEDIVDHKMLPRLSAFAESGWSSAGRKRWEGFLHRVTQGLGPRWDRHDVAYYRDPALSWSEGHSPAVRSSEWVDSLSVVLEFSSDVTAGSALDPRHYLVEEGSGALSCMELLSPRRVRLTWECSEGDSLCFAVSGVRSGPAPWQVVTDSLSADGLYRDTLRRPRTVLPVIDGKRPLSADIFPQPWQQAEGAGGPTVRIQLREAGNVSLTIFDATGSVRQTQDYGTRASGMHWLRFPSAHLSRGVYWLRIRAGSDIIHKKFIVQQ